MNYKKLFTDNVLYITGAGRSGTTIMGQVLASMSPVYYLFEPAILRPPITDNRETLRRNVFEDGFLPEILGRCNSNPTDWTYWGNYMDEAELKDRQALGGRRSDAITHIEQEKPLFVVKNPEAQHMTGIIKEILPGVKFINIIRNGLDVVSSCMERGWFTDGYQPIDDYSIREGFGWFDDRSKAKWAGWSPATRAAHLWRVLVEFHCSHPQRFDFANIRYETFCHEPENTINAALLSLDMELVETPKTWELYQSIKSWKPEATPRVTLKDIEQPERDKFVAAMERLGYL